MKLKIKYFEGAVKLEKIAKGNWIDVYANKTVFIPEGASAMIPLGFALELPKNWEGYLLPRSSTFKTWGIIQTNGEGVVDDTYIGDNDQWHMPVYCLVGKQESNMTYGCKVRGTHIFSGDKIGQFRIMEVMPNIELEEVEHLGNENRGGFGTTGTVKIEKNSMYGVSTDDKINEVQERLVGFYGHHSNCNQIPQIVEAQNKLSSACGLASDQIILNPESPNLAAEVSKLVENKLKEQIERRVRYE